MERLTALRCDPPKVETYNDLWPQYGATWQLRTQLTVIF